MKAVIVPFTLLTVLFIFTVGIYINLFIFMLITWKTVMAGFLVAFCGYAFGAIFAWLCRLNVAQITAVSIEVNRQRNVNFEWNRRVCEWGALLVKSVSKLYLQVDLICQNRHLVSYRRVPGSIPGRGSIDYFSSFPHFSLF